MRYSHHHNLLDQHNILNPNNTGLYSNYPLGPSWFPLREKTNLQRGWDNMFLQLGKTFFKGVSNPYAVYMGVGKIDYLEMPSTILDTKPKNKMNKKGLKIYLLEPLSTYHINDDPDKGPLYTNYEIDDIQNIRAKELDSISKFVERNGLTNVNVYTPDYKINDYFGLIYPDLNLFCSPVGWCYPATMDLNIEIPPSKDIVKKFWCGNWKYASHRHLIASYLAGNFDSSDYNLSWIYSSSQSILRNNLWFDITNLPNYENILEGAQKLDLIAPSTMGVELNDALDINEPAPELHIDTNPVEYYNECFCAIVNETRFAQATGILTEKIMNPMINCKPFIMVGPPGNLEYMRKWGFQTFSDYWDESYDNEECHHKRLAKIFKLINWLGSMSIEELRELYEKMLPTVMFNQVHILDLQEKLLQEPITKNILFKRLG